MLRCIQRCVITLINKYEDMFELEVNLFDLREKDCKSWTQTRTNKIFEKKYFVFFF